MPLKILLVEDDAETADYVAHALTSAGHQVDSAGDGTNGLSRAQTDAYAALIVDRMLPGIDGLTMVRQLRAAGSETPILFLTTMSGIDDRVEGLEGGADDYLVKPFAREELLARLQALMRRGAQGNATVLTVAGLDMDLIRRSVTRGGRSVDLQAQEFKLLEYLMRNAGRAVTRTMLLENVWNLNFDPRTNVVETHISRLRSKLDQGQEPGEDRELIRTIRGKGYILLEPEN